MSKSELVPPLRLCFFMWLVFTLQFYTGFDFGQLGIYPRTLSGLIGVFAAPLIHGNINHLISNTLPLLILGGSIYFFYPRIANRVFLQAYFFTNILVWVFARPFLHIGASGLVYALASFLIFFGFFQQNFKTVIISGVVIFFYGGMMWYGLFPLDGRVSWESHLMGAIVGLVTAFTIPLSKRI